MRIPEIEERLHKIADELILPMLFPRRDLEDIGIEIHHLALSTKRRVSIRKAPSDSRPMTPALAEAIRQDKAAHPNYTYERIAQRHGVNVARVSEALRGKRK